MKKTIILFPVLAMVLTACDAVSERDCGVFDHPEFVLWQPDSLGTQVQFMSGDGTTINFTRQAVVFNEPFLGTDGASNDEDVVCELSAQVSLRADDESLTFTSTYLQLEQLLLPSESESLIVRHTLEAPVGTVLSGSFVADISVNAGRSLSNNGLVIYLEDDVLTEEIGGFAYEDVIRINAIDLTPDVEAPEGESIDVIQQIVMAQNFGIVAFTDDEGREFVRIASQ